MAEKDKKKDEALVEAKKDEAPPAEQKAAAPAAAPAPLMSFERWLAASGKPAHWKHGMAKFADTRGKKTADQWAAIFKAY